MPRISRGFTLTELITIIILLGIISIFVVGKFIGRSGFDEYTLRSRLQASLRLVQMEAMQERDSSLCHQIAVERDRFGVPTASSGVAYPCDGGKTIDDIVFDDALQPNRATKIDDKANVVFSAAFLPFAIQFDGWGRPQRDCAGGCTIIIAGESALQLRIESEGYIHEVSP